MAGGPLRVLYVTHTAARGGCNSSLRYLIENLPDGAVDATVVSPPGPAVDGFRSAGARVIVVPGVSMLQSIHGAPMRGWRTLEVLRTLWFLRYGTRIRAAIRQVRPDIVHLNERGMLQAARIAHREGIPVVVHARSVMHRSTRWVKAIGDAALNRYASIVVPIDESVSWSIRDVRRRRVVYNPLNLRTGEGIPARERSARSGPIRVTYLSGLLRYKGIWDLLEAARRLQHRRDIEFRIAGANSRPAAFHRSLTGRLVRAIGLVQDVESDIRRWLDREHPGNVTLLGHVDDTVALLAETDILVFPSHLNGPGRSVFEAGVHGIPAIVALADRIEDVVRDGETGLIVPERDPGALAHAIERLASDHELRRRLGDEARRRYAVQFDPRRIGAEMLDVYESVLALSPAPAVLSRVKTA